MTQDAEPSQVMDGPRWRVSVLIPSLNSGQYIQHAVESVLYQDPPAHEIVVQDGGSTDGTLDTLGRFGDAVRVHSEPDTGQSDALNRAINRASGDIFVWLNADDLLVPGAIGAATDAFRRIPDAEMVYGDFDMIREDGSVARGFRSSSYSPRRVFTHGCYIFSGAMFVTRSLVSRVGPYDENLDACMDFDFLMRIGEAKTVHVGRTVAQFRLRDEQKSSTIRSTFLRESHAIRWRAAGRSRSLRLLTLLLDARDSAYLATTRIRYSRAWAAIRGRRRL